MNLDVLIPSLAPPADIPANLQPPKLARRSNTCYPAPITASIARPTRVSLGASSNLASRHPIPGPHSTAEYDGLDATGHGWICADLVHLVPDRDRLRMTAL